MSTESPNGPGSRATPDVSFEERDVQTGTIYVICWPLPSVVASALIVYILRLHARITRLH